MAHSADNARDTSATWWWRTGVSFNSLLGDAEERNARLTDIESDVVGGTRYWAGLMLPNTGADATVSSWGSKQSGGQGTSHALNRIAPGRQGAFSCVHPIWTGLKADALLLNMFRHPAIDFSKLLLTF